MSVAVSVGEVTKCEEGFGACYSLDYASADGATRVSASYESRTPDEYEAAADAIASGLYYCARGGPANGEATFEIDGGQITFEHCGYGDGGGSLSVALPAAPWEAAFRAIAQVLRTGKAPEPAAPQAPQAQQAQ